MKKLLVTLLVLNSSLLAVKAQDKQLIDSFQTQLKLHYAAKLKLGSNATALYDSTAATILKSLAFVYIGNDPDKAMVYANQSMDLSKHIGYKKGIGNAYNCLGVINWSKGNYSAALDFHKKGLQIRLEMGDKKGIASSYNNLGNVYWKQGNFTEALKNHFASLKINEEMGDKGRIADSYNNIGLIYNDQGNYAEAMKNDSAALKIRQEIGDENGIANSYNNIAQIYANWGKYSESLTYNYSSLKIREEIGDSDGISTSYTNIGNIYKDQGNYPIALKNHLAALKIEQDIADEDGIIDSYVNIGTIYIKDKNFNDASEYLNKALTSAKKVGNVERIKESYQSLALLDSAQGNFSKSLEDYKRFITFRDSLVNDANSKKTLALQMNYDFGKKQDSIKADQVKKDALTGKEIENQKRIRNYVLGGLVIVLFFLVFVFFQRNKIAKEKKRSDELLLNILPSEVADELKDKGNADAKTFDSVTVIFTDFKDFTKISEKLSAKELVAEIDYCFKGFDAIIHKYNIEKIKTIGDSYMAAGGLPVPNKTHAKDIVNAALEIVAFMEAHKQQRLKENKPVFEIRIGINTGPVVAGIVGVKKFAYDIWGDTVNLASRMESSGEPGKVNISGSTYELVKSDFTCTYRGKIQAKNKGEVDMYFVS